MNRTIAIFGVGLACVIAMSSACPAAENNAEHQSSARSPLVVAQAKQLQPTEADKKKLSEEIQKRYKPGPGSKALLPGQPKKEAGTLSTCTGSTAQIAACSGACSASCIFKCFNPKEGNFPWSADCHSCVNACMDKCTGCGSGTTQ
jgi:hypothetical protein